MLHSAQLCHHMSMRRSRLLVLTVLVLSAALLPAQMAGGGAMGGGSQGGGSHGGGLPGAGLRCQQFPAREVVCLATEPGRARPMAFSRCVPAVTVTTETETERFGCLMALRTGMMTVIFGISLRRSAAARVRQQAPPASPQVVVVQDKEPRQSAPPPESPKLIEVPQSKEAPAAKPQPPDVVRAEGRRTA